MSFTGAQKVYSNYKDLIPKEDQLPTKLAPTNDYLVKQEKPFLVISRIHSEKMI